MFICNSPLPTIFCKLSLKINSFAHCCWGSQREFFISWWIIIYILLLRIHLFASCCWESVSLQFYDVDHCFCKMLMKIIFFLQIVVQDDLQLLVWDDFLTNWHKGSLVRNFCCKHFLQIAEVDHYFLKIVIGDHLLQLFSIIFSQRGWESPLCKLLLGIIFPNCGSLFATWCPRSICLQMFVEDPYLCKVLLWMRSLQFFVVEIFWKRRVVFLQCTNGDYYQYQYQYSGIKFKQIVADGRDRFFQIIVGKLFGELWGRCLW